MIWGFANESICSGGGSPPNKGYSNSTTVAFDVCDAEQQNWSSCPWRKRWAPDSGRTVLKSVWWRWESGIICSEYHSHQISLETPTNITRELYGAACRAFDEARGIRRRSAIWASIQVTFPQRNPGGLGSSTAWITKAGENG